MKVDSIFTNAKVYNVFLKEWDISDIAVLSGKILYIGDVKKAGLSAKEFIDCHGKLLIPGLIDIHLHIESSLCTPTTFAAAVLPRGITTVVTEPHEIANVFGISGIEEMIKASREAVIDIFYGVPSSVPSTSKELETTGGTIDLKELEELVKKYPEIICLGEVMNYSGLINGFTRITSKTSDLKTPQLIEFLRQLQPLAAIEGHCPSVRDLDLAKLLYLGVDSDHCLQDIEGIKQRFANGMFIEIQEKSLSPEIVGYLQNNNTKGLYSFVTDDVPPDILADKGHLDYVVRKAMNWGLSLESVIYATSFAPSQRMGFRDRGKISPGQIADFIILEDDSASFNIQRVFKKGILFEKDNYEIKGSRFNSSYLNSLNVQKGIEKQDHLYSIPVDLMRSESSSINCRIMEKNIKNTYTKSIIRNLPISGGFINWEDAGVNLALVIERYSGSSEYSRGLMGGDRISNGAFCTSHAHDHHNILIIGSNKSDMQKAFKQVLSLKGGMCVVSEGNIMASLPLPVGGIISEAPMHELTADVKAIQNSLSKLGLKHANPIMSLCTLTLPVSPELKITDKGLIDVTQSKIVSLIVE
jgi:adenine deaminase